MLHTLFLTVFTFVTLNCENLFDAKHDTLKQDLEYCEGGSRHWSTQRYWHKLNNIGREIISCGGEEENWVVPDLVALVEVENDTVLHDLTRRSILRNAGYEYLMTDSPDPRGIDVALLYHPFSFTPDTAYSIRITPPEGYKATRDILYVRGDCFLDGDSTMRLHAFVVHSPSRSGGSKVSEQYRIHVASRLCQSIDSIYRGEAEAKILVMGDFNDYHTDKSLRLIGAHGMKNVSAGARGTNGAEGTYRHQGRWGSLDHILISTPLYGILSIDWCRVNDAPFLYEEEPTYGGIRPRRTYRGFKYDYGGYSDHFPLVFRFSIP